MEARAAGADALLLIVAVLGDADLKNLLAETAPDGRRDAGAHFASFVVDRDDRHRDVGAERMGTVARQLLELLLQGRVDGQAVDALPRLQHHDLVGGVRRQRRQRLALTRHRLGLGAGALVFRNDALRDGPVEHDIARPAGGGGTTVRPAKLRRLRQGDQKRGLRESQPLRLLRKVSQRRRADAFQIAAIGRQRQIKRQDLALGQRGFELQRAGNLAQLGAEAAVLARLQKARDLH